MLNAQVLTALRDNVVTITKLFTISQAVSTWIHVEHGSRCAPKDKLDARSFQVCQVVCAGLIPFLAEILAEAVQVVESVLRMLPLPPQPPGSSATALAMEHTRLCVLVGISTCYVCACQYLRALSHYAAKD